MRTETDSSPSAASINPGEGDDPSSNSFQGQSTMVATLVMGVTVLVVAGITLLSGGGLDSSSYPAESVITQDSPSHQVIFENQHGDTLRTYDVWVAKTPGEQYRGLSRTDTLPEGTGLLFVYDREAADRAIVMREMNYPIDVVFIDGTGTVTAVHSAVLEPGVPEDELTRYSGRARWVLELPHRTTERHAIAPGRSVRITAAKHA